MTSDDEVLAARDYFAHQFDGQKVVPLLDELLERRRAETKRPRAKANRHKCPVCGDAGDAS
jgi:hypothetical protein